MLWELIATFSAGLGAAGLALLLRRVYKRLSKGIVPVAAGLGMLAFQIYSEYSWFADMRSRLPQGTQIVAEFPQSAFYKPWSYIWPPVLRFVAVDTLSSAVLTDNPHQRQIYLYFFERRMSAKAWPVVIDCDSGEQANLNSDGKGIDNTSWQQTPYSATIAKAVCPQIVVSRTITPN